MVSEKRGQDELRSKKETCDMRWNSIYTDMLKGAKVDHQRLADVMKQTNDADMAFIERQLIMKKLQRKKDTK